MRFSGFMVVSASCSAFISPSPLYRCTEAVPLAFHLHVFEQTASSPPACRDARSLRPTNGGSLYFAICRASDRNFLYSGCCARSDADAAAPHWSNRGTPPTTPSALRPRAVRLSPARRPARLARSPCFPCPGNRPCGRRCSSAFPSTSTTRESRSRRSSLCNICSNSSRLIRNARSSPPSSVVFGPVPFECRSPPSGSRWPAA